MPLILDTGPLLAALDQADPDHASCAALLLHDVLEGVYTVAPPTITDLRPCELLQRRYADLRVGIVDASILALCERLAERKLATLGHRHFAAVRPGHVDALDLLPHP